jgi:crotonobetaine/carnitine-CoA ligase
MSKLDTSTLAELVRREISVRHLIESRAAELGGETYLQFKQQAYSYDVMDRLANRAANGLAQRGVGRGDRVAVMMRNSVEWLAAWFGTVKLGAVIVPVNAAYRGDGLAHVVNDCGASVAFVDADLHERFEAIREKIPRLHTLVTRAAEGVPAIGLSLPELLDAGDSRPAEVELRPRDPAAILYTSGTTGPAKGCVLPHGQYLAAAHQMNDNNGYSRGTVLYSCLPLNHINAQNYSVLCSWAAGGQLALDAKFTASGFWQRLIDTGADAFNIIGGIPLMLWAQPERPEEKLHKAQTAFGVPVPLDIWERWEERFGVRVVYAYGMTENGLPTVFPYEATPAAASLRGSGGRASPSADVAVVDEDDQPVAPGIAGEIVTRPKIPWTMMLEYYNNPAATVNAWRNGWFHTGDLGYLDDAGYLFYVDRKKDAMRRRGEMVSSWEVENVSGKYPGVNEAAAYGIPSELGEDEVMTALVVDDPGSFNPADFVAFCQDHLAAFQVPRYVRLVSEIPRTQTARIEKYKLRAEGVTADTFDAMTSA